MAPVIVHDFVDRLHRGLMPAATLANCFGVVSDVAFLDGRRLATAVL